MLQAMMIGYLGAPAEVKNANGKDFVTFRIANTERWTDQAGQSHETTTWVDCVMNGKPNVTEFLLKGTMVYLIGSCSLRVYSSPKDKCMKAGMTINVSKLELLGGKPEEIPSRLFKADTNERVEVVKYYGVAEMLNRAELQEPISLIDSRGNAFVTDEYGWVKKVENQSEQ